MFKSISQDGKKNLEGLVSTMLMSFYVQNMNGTSVPSINFYNLFTVFESESDFPQCTILRASRWPPLLITKFWKKIAFFTIKSKT